MNRSLVGPAVTRSAGSDLHFRSIGQAVRAFGYDLLAGVQPTRDLYFAILVNACLDDGLARDLIGVNNHHRTDATICSEHCHGWNH